MWINYQNLSIYMQILHITMISYNLIKGIMEVYMADMFTGHYPFIVMIIWFIAGFIGSKM